MTALPALEPEYWAALFGVECSVVEVCNLCGRLTCAGCGPSMVVFVLDKAHVTACEGCLGHGHGHYTDPERARTAREQALERVTERRRATFPGLSALKGSLGRLRGKKGRKIENTEPQRATEELE